MQTFIQILPAFRPEREAERERHLAEQNRREADRLRHNLQLHVAAMEKWLPPGLASEEPARREIRKAEEMASVHETRATTIAAKPARPPVANIQCFNSYEHRADLKARGYAFTRQAFHPVTHKDKPAWQRRIEISGTPASAETASDNDAVRLMQPLMDELDWLKARGTVRQKVGVDPFQALAAGDPTLIGV